jgi:hypothetical protein
MFGVQTPMSEGVASTMIAAMPTRRLIIELESSALPRGRVVGIRGEEIEFAGWVELAAALERARAGPTRSEPRSGPADAPELRRTSAPE